MSKTKLYALIVALITAHSLCAQSYSTSPIEKDFADTLSIEIYNNWIILPVAINGKEHRFIFDTGCSASMVSNNLISEEWDVVRRDTVNDANNVRKEVSYVSFCGLSIGKLHFPCYPVIPHSFEGTPFECPQIDGLIGGDILQNMYVKIDIQNKQLILTDRKKWFKKEKGANAPMKIRGNCPFITLRIGRIRVQDVMFDSGNTGFYSLSENIFSQLKAFKPEWWKGEIIDTAKGATSFGLFGFAKEETISLVKLPEWKLNGIPFENVYTKTSVSSHCNLGAELLSYGQVILNYPEKRFTFLPYNQVKSVIKTATVRPINIGFEDGHIVISLIFESSGYYQQGLRRGDRIIEINNREINDDFCILTEVLTEEIKQIKVIDKKGNEKEFHSPDPSI